MNNIDKQYTDPFLGEIELLKVGETSMNLIGESVVHTIYTDKFNGHYYIDTWTTTGGDPIPIKIIPKLKMSSGHNFRAALAGKADEIDLNDFILLGYDPHPTIKAPLSN
jgi:hypothetical protein